MAPPRYTDCFDFLIRLSKICGYAPFCPEAKLYTFLSRFNITFNIILLFRVTATVILGLSGSFLSLDMGICVVDCFIKYWQIIRRSQDYELFFQEIDDFLRENEFNVFNGKRNYFMDLWKKQKPDKLIVFYTVSVILAVTVWSYNTLHNALVSPEVPRPLYWSPYFDSGYVIKWCYIIFEFFVAYTLILFPLYLLAFFTSIVKFQYARFIYVREMAVHVAKCKFQREKVVWWIKVHQKTLMSAYRISDLLGLHAFSSYFVISLLAVVSMIMFLFEPTEQFVNMLNPRLSAYASQKNTTQDDGQKVIAPFLVALLMGQFLLNCMISDQWEEEEREIKDLIFNDGLLKTDKWRLSVYKICMLRLNKPVTFQGLGFVTMNSVTCRMIVTNIYSMYTSLRSVLKRGTP